MPLREPNLPSIAAVTLLTQAALMLVAVTLDAHPPLFLGGAVAAFLALALGWAGLQGLYDGPKGRTGRMYLLGPSLLAGGFAADWLSLSVGGPPLPGWAGWALGFLFFLFPVAHVALALRDRSRAARPGDAS